MRKLRTLLQYRYTFKIITIVVILINIMILHFYNYRSIYKQDVNNIIGIVEKYNIDDNKLIMYVKNREIVVTKYYFSSLDEKQYYIDNLELGSKIQIYGTLEQPSSNTVKNTFNYKRYLNNKNIYYIMNVSKIKIINNNTNILYMVKNLLIKRIDMIDKDGYLRVFILGDKGSMDSDIISIYQSNGISHLFSVSGMHISVFIGIIMFILDKLTYNRYVKYGICILFLLFYIFMCGGSSSILRAGIMFIIFSINKVFNLKIKSIDLVFLTLDVLLIINPRIIFDVGFQFSYLISFTLIVLGKKIKNIKGYFRKKLYISFICFLVSFPIVISNYYEINFLSIILNILLIPVISIIIFPLCIITLVVPGIFSVLSVFINILEIFNKIVGSINFFRLVLVKPNIILIILYYLIIYLSIRNKKNILFFIIIVLIHKNLGYFNNSMEVSILDVGQGDSIFVRLPNNKGNILIDTGGFINYNYGDWAKRRNEYSIVKSKTIPYLKSLGIDKIDYLILSHGDYDHMGEAIKFVENFRVGNVIFNIDDYNDLEQELIKVLDEKNVKYYKGLKELNIDKYTILFLNTGLYDNENDNSNVIYFKFNKFKFLFMGDAGVDREKDILEKYNIKDIDFLKVGHHGSNTSSSDFFIDSIKPRNCLISVGVNNRYGHPKEEVLDILNEYCDIYRIDLNGSIEIKLKKDNYKIKTIT